MTTRTLSGARLAALLPDPSGAVPRYVELADAIVVLLGDGRLLGGTRLPSERELGDALGVSRGTVTRAYDLLRERGDLSSRRGSGSVLRSPSASRVATGARRRSDAAASQPAWRNRGAQPHVVDLTTAAVPGSPRLQEWFERATTDLPAHLGGTGNEPLGLPVLREEIAAGYERRGLATSVDQVIVTTGALAGLSAVAHAFAAPGDRVLLESPVYPGALRAVRAVGTRPVGLPVEAFGAPDQLAAVLRQSAPRLAVLTPDFHNPTGALMGSARRRSVAADLARARVVTVVDETLLHTGLEPDVALPPPFAAGTGDVITLGSTSKSHWGGLRVGWIRAPHEHVDRIVAARAGLDLGASIHAQLVVTRMLRAGFDVLPHVTAGARERRDFLAVTVRERLPEWAFEVPAGGACLWCRLPVEASTELVTRCAARGVALAAGSAFAVDGAGLDRFVRLPFTLSSPQLARAVDAVAGAWSELLEVRGRRARPSDSDLTAVRVLA